MANQITDNRTLLTANNAGDTAPDDLSGAADTASDTATFINGSSSRPWKTSASVAGRLYDAGSAQDWTDNTFYLWYLCTSVTDTVANGGVRVRFCGATVTDYFEKHVDGGNSKGWSMAVVDIVKARADAIGGTDGGTGGTVPAVNAIRYVGIVFDVPGMISGNTDNCFINGFWRLPTATPGIIIEGRNGGSTDWTFDDIANAGDKFDPTKAWGTIENEDGVLKCSTPIQIGINDTTTHGFTDSNKTLAWKDALVADDLYGISLLGNAGGTTNFILGLKSGTGDDANGSQGGTITAASSGVRWFFDASDANLDTIDLYGASFQHGSDFSLNNSVVDAVGVFFNDCTSADVIGASIVRASVINPNTADGVAFMTLDTLDDIAYCNFEFTDGHAIEITTTSTVTQVSTGNRFTGFGATGTNDAAIYNNSGAVAKIISIITPGASGEHTYRNGTSAATTLSQDVVLTWTILDELTGLGIENARIEILKDSDKSQLISPLSTNASGVATTTIGFTVDTDIVGWVRQFDITGTDYVQKNYVGTITSVGFTQTILLTPIT